MSNNFKALSKLICNKEEELRVLKMQKSSEKKILSVIHELLYLKTKYKNKQNEIVDWIENMYPTEKWGTSMEDLGKTIRKLFREEIDPKDDVDIYEEEEDYHYQVYKYSKLLEYNNLFM